MSHKLTKNELEELRVYFDHNERKNLIKKVQKYLLKIDDSNYNNRIPMDADEKKLEVLKNITEKRYLLRKITRIKQQFEFANRNINSYIKLTNREKEIIQLLVLGKNNPVIAQELFISRYTVEQHRKNINHKLKIESFPHLMLYAYAFDLI